MQRLDIGRESVSPARKPLWRPSKTQISQANITRFIAFAGEKYGLSFRNYDDLYEWSVERIPEFWAAVWDFAGIKASRGYDRVIDDLSRFPGARWFPGARLNFAENLLRYRDDRTAFIFKGEDKISARMTYAQLFLTVARLAKSLREMGVKPGDRVAAYMPNLIETAVAMLAATSLGAVWSSCASDLGADAVLDRLAQIEPKVLFAFDGYYYRGKLFDGLARVSEVARGIPSLEKVVIIRYTGRGESISHIPNAVYYEQFTSHDKSPELQFAQLPADHPLYIMFSSGTTGKPKCLVQSAGGILANHLKELVLHSDLRREDTIFYITTCSWMMWNWLLSSLGVGATIVLYDGNPTYPDIGALWRLVEQEKITVFGMSASYINLLKSEGCEPGKLYKLSSLREISQTGSVLSKEGFEYLYQSVKQDMHFNSISGGTDINGCFAAGSPTLPVYAGEVQRRALGMKVKCYDETGKPVMNKMGEMVCEAPSPSMPLYFWNDPDNQRYLESYFSVYPGVWRHGDYIIIHGDTLGVSFFGRSDSVLKPSGVRIGTAEIYNAIEKVPEIADSLAIGQEWQGDQRIILFVKMTPGHTLTGDIKENIRNTLRDRASPRHIPALIIEVPDIPYTFNMKKVESAVMNIVNGRPVTNRDALVNPSSLDFYQSIRPELQKRENSSSK